MKFGMMAHNPYSGPTAEILNKFLKIQDGGGCRLEKSQNCDISATVSPIFIEFCIMMQNGSLFHLDR